MASTTLYRAASTATGATKYTLSMWIKRSNISVEQTLIGVESGTTVEIIKFNADDKLYWYNRDAAGNAAESSTTQVFRDLSAYYNLVFSYDSTQASAADQKKIYVNGVATTWGSEAAIQSNAVPGMNLSGATRYIGREGAGTSYYYDGLISCVSFIDGTGYDQSYFGSTQAASGIWQIKTSPAVTYGNNGFFLKMDTSSPGTDTSGNSNTFTASGTPTLTQDNASNNFATMNSLDNYWAGSTFTNGNLSIATVTGNDTYNNATMGYSTGKWYWETKIIQSSTYDQVGITSKGSIATNNYMSNSLYSVVIKQDGNLWQNAGSGSGAVGGWSGTSWTTGDIIGIAHDATNNKIYVHKNGTYMNSGNPTTGSNGADTTASSSTDTGVWLPAVGDEISSGTASQFALNFGNGFFGTTAVASSNADAAGYGLFEYAVPTGYYTLCTKNLNTYG